jgi:hypothetical protein
MRYPIRSARILTQRIVTQRGFRFALLLCVAVLCQPIQPVYAQTASPQAQTASPQERPMKHYALLFHTSRTLTPDEQKQRALDIAAWVKGVTEMGVALDPRSLGETAANFSTEGGEIVSRHGSSDPTFSNIVFFDCSSREQAVEIARRHPGLHYGVTVEVRQWTSPRETAAKP